jgi:tight adherence protein B
VAGLIDPVTLAALAIGVMTAAAFTLVVALADTPNGRRFKRRLDGVKAYRAQRRTQLDDEAPTRSLTRRESATPKMDRIVQRWLPQRNMLALRLEQTGRTISIGQFMLVVLGLSVVGAGIAAGIFGFGILPSLLFAVSFGVAVPHFVVGRMGRKRTAAFIQLFPEAIDLMVRALRSGLPISEAIVNAGHEIADPVGVEFRQIESGMRLGRELDNILWDIAKRITAPEFRFFIIALTVQRETGGNLAETLSNLADVLRRRRTMRAKARAMASEARASTIILGSLPIIVTGILFLTSPSYVSLLFTDVRGLILVGIALGMLVTGIAIMVKMARFEI